MADDAAARRSRAPARGERGARRKRALTRERLRRASAVLLLVLGCGLARAVGGGDLAAGDAARHRPLRRDGRADRRRARRPAGGRGQARHRDQQTHRLRTRSPARCCPTAPTCSRPRSQRGVQSFDPHAASTSSRASPRFQELWIEANRRAHTRIIELLDRRALRTAGARRRHGLPRPLARGRPRQGRACRSAG